MIKPVEAQLTKFLFVVCHSQHILNFIYLFIYLFIIYLFPFMFRQRSYLDTKQVYYRMSLLN